MLPCGGDDRPRLSPSRPACLPLEVNVEEVSDTGGMSV